MHNSKAIPGLLFTYATWSLAGVIASIAAFGPAGVLVQGIFMFGVLVIFSGAKGIRLSFQESKITIPYSILRALTLGSLYYTYLHLKVGIVDTIVACYIFVLVCVFAPLSGEKFNPKVIWPMLVSTIGVGLITGAIPNTNTFETKSLFALLTMFLAASSFVLFRRCALLLKPMNHLTYMHGWASVFCIPILTGLVILGAIDNNLIPNSSQLFVLLLASFFGFVGDYVYAAVQKISTLTLNGLIAPSAVLFSCIYGFVLKGETLTTYQLTGVVFVAISLSYVNYISAKQKHGQKITEQKPSLEIALAA